ncbi:MAG: hypothetical protein PUP93_09570 [Rhizonema sp. NSF051]|nr:hypothetical protein [Rhizonema sp. NSF051]
MADTKHQPITDEELQELKDITPDPLDFDLREEVKRPSFRSKVIKAGLNRIKSLVIKEAAGAAEIPGLNVGLAAYDAYEFGVEVYHFYREEQKIEAALKEKKAIEALFKKTEKIAFYKQKELERATKSRRLEKDLDLINYQKEKLDRQGIKYDIKDKGVGENPYSKDFGGTAFAKEESLIKSKLEKVMKRSFEERISKINNTASARDITKENLKKSEQIANHFEKNKFVGTADEKHHYLLTYTAKKLSKEHFDTVMHPERITRFHQFSIQKLYSDGYEMNEIKSALSHDPFIKGVDKADDYIEHLAGSVRWPNKSAENLKNWRINNEISLLDKRSPAEHKFVERMTQQEEQFLSLKRAETKYFEAKAAKDKHIEDLQKGIEKRLTTIEEYRVELGRNHALGTTSNIDENMAFKLKLAGHHDDKIIEAINEASPYASSKDYGQLKVIEARRYLSTPQGQEVTEIINKLKANHPHLENETRLNKLGLHTQESSIVYHYRDDNVRRFDRTVDYLHPEERSR